MIFAVSIDPGIALIFVVMVAFTLLMVLAADLGLLNIREDDRD